MRSQMCRQKAKVTTQIDVSLYIRVARAVSVALLLLLLLLLSLSLLVFITTRKEEWWSFCVGQKRERAVSCK